jgi:hypothetical protein
MTPLEMALLAGVVIVGAVAWCLAVMSPEVDDEQ